MLMHDPLLAFTGRLEDLSGIFEEECIAMVETMLLTGLRPREIAHLVDISSEHDLAQLESLLTKLLHDHRDNPIAQVISWHLEPILG
jgi:hypothetical protein